MTSSWDNQCYVAGSNAFLEGKSIKDNPFREEMIEWQWWNTGWTDTMIES